MSVEIPDSNQSVAPTEIVPEVTSTEGVSPWAPPSVESEAPSEVVEPTPSPVIGPPPGYEGEWKTPEPGPGTPIDVVSDLTEVPPYRKPIEVPRLGGPGSEQDAAMIAAAKPPAPETPTNQT